MVLVRATYEVALSPFMGDFLSVDSSSFAFDNRHYIAPHEACCTSSTDDLELTGCGLAHTTESYHQCFFEAAFAAHDWLANLSQITVDGLVPGTATLALFVISFDFTNGLLSGDCHHHPAQ